MASSVCISRCRLLIKLDLNRGFNLSPFVNGISNTKESWCRRWRPQAVRRSLCTSSPVAGSTTRIKPVTVKDDDDDGVVVRYVRGLPVAEIPLPSRRERCRFTLRPVSQSVGDLLRQLRAEDAGVERAAVLAEDRVRIAASDSIESLLRDDFRLVINDTEYYVKTPLQESMSAQEVTRLSDVRSLVNQLYEALNVREHQLRKERELRGQLERLADELQPLEEKRTELERDATRRTSVLTWVGLGMMGVQFGVLARLTWWEYSWDIMEPVTYFVTYGTAMAAYAYFVLTKQEYILPDVKDRQHLLTLHKKAKKMGLDLNKYNDLKEKMNKVESDLMRLRDPLHIHLPPKLGEDSDHQKKSPLSKIKDILDETSKKIKKT